MTKPSDNENLYAGAAIFRIVTFRSLPAKLILILSFHRLDQGDGTNDFDGIKLQNEPSEATVENLINLPYLHEPAILHCLQNRYVGGDIYTYTGPILIALNPFKAVPLYTPQILESYYNFGLLKGQGIEGGKPLPPHVYAVADAAYRDMMRVISHSSETKTMAMMTRGEVSANILGSKIRRWLALYAMCLLVLQSL